MSSNFGASTSGKRDQFFSNDNHTVAGSCTVSNLSSNMHPIFGISAKRLQKELKEIELDLPSNCSAGLMGDSLYQWESKILGPSGSAYEGGVFYVDICLSPKYPFEPPLVKFRTKIYHCNISSSGCICLDILSNNWSPALTIAKVLLSISSMLTDCNPFNPLEGQIADQYLKNRKNHDEMARSWTEKFAK